MPEVSHVVNGKFTSKEHFESITKSEKHRMFNRDQVEENRQQFDHPNK